MIIIEIIVVLLRLILVQIIHPVIMVFCVVFGALLIVILISILSERCWIRYVIMLIFLGGLLVLFVYISSLISDEYLVRLNYLKMMMLVVIFAIGFRFDLGGDENFVWGLSRLKFIMVYRDLIVWVFGWFLIYLLFVLIVVFRLTGINWGPLRVIYG